jgi:hypothetical protein
MPFGFFFKNLRPADGELQLSVRKLPNLWDLVQEESVVASLEEPRTRPWNNRYEEDE